MEPYYKDFYARLLRSQSDGLRLATAGLLHFSQTPPNIIPGMHQKKLCLKHAEPMVQWRSGMRKGKPRLRWFCRRCEAERVKRQGLIAGHECKREWDKRNPIKRKAHKTVENALLSGRLSRKPCETCGRQKVQAHHDDYNKPLDVRWLCSSCHHQHHHQIRLSNYVLQVSEAPHGA